MTSTNKFLVVSAVAFDLLGHVKATYHSGGNKKDVIVLEFPKKYLKSTSAEYF